MLGWSIQSRREIRRHVSITGRTLVKLEGTASLIREKTGKVLKRFAHDLRQSGESAAFIEETAAAFGGVDIVVTCAGDLKRGHLTDISQDEWKEGSALMIVGAGVPMPIGRKYMI